MSIPVLKVNMCIYVFSAYHVCHMHGQGCRLDIWYLTQNTFTVEIQNLQCTGMFWHGLQMSVATFILRDFFVYFYFTS